MNSVVIVGASLAGIRCAGSLRRSGFDGSIALVGDEPHRPYDRPPLSKQYLNGDWDVDRLHLVQPDAWDELDVTLHASNAAVALDVAATAVTLADGSVIAGDAIVLATGARPRTLPRSDALAGVHVLRTLDDASMLRAELGGEAKKVVVIGAGFIGAEAAATAHRAGHQVTIIEAATVPMERGLGPVIGTICGDLHREEGVDLRLSTGVTSLLGHDAITGVELDDGSVLDADIVVIGIGVVPNTEWLHGSGLTIDNGIVANEYCEAAPNVYAAGDVARWTNPMFAGELMRVEHWENAVEQGNYVGRRIAGIETEAFAPVPWFWSDQYSYKLQLAGRPTGTDDMKIIDGSIEEKRFAAIFGRNGMLTGVFGLNRPKHVMQYRMQMTQGATWDDALAFAEAAAAKKS